MKKFSEELDKLIIFVTVAEKGKINEGAEKLHLTQPSVTRAIQKLEEAFGSSLFIRSRAGVQLTYGGTLLYENAIRILKELGDIQVRARVEQTDLAGKLTVGTYESLAEYLWPDFLFKLQKSHPELQLSIKTGLQPNPHLDLTNEKIDLLVDAQPQTKSSLLSWPLYSDRFGFFVSASRKTGTLNQTEASTETITYVGGACDEERITIEEHLYRANYSFARTHCFDSFSTAKTLALRNMGVAVLPLKLAKADETQKLIKRFTLAGFNPEGFGRHTIYATTLEKTAKNARLKKVVALLRAHFR